MIRRLIILLLIVGCEETTAPEPEDGIIPSPSVICDNSYSELDGSLVSCASECIESEGNCYHQNDIDVLSDIIELDSLDVPYLQLGVQEWTQGRLVSLNLSTLQIDTLPNSISNFTALKSLDLSYTLISTLPDTICAIYDSLSILTLHHSHICPPYPECITGEDLSYQYQDHCESIGCMDSTACNYDESALYPYLTIYGSPSGGCWHPNEGCECDMPEGSIVDECGVCDGDGIIQECGCGQLGIFGIPEGNCDCDDNKLDCKGICNGEGEDLDNNGICDDLQGSLTDIEGNVYLTVKLGSQNWMAENLNVSKYRNGDDIPYKTEVNYNYNIPGAYFYYDNNSSLENIYGKLYTWEAVRQERDICPEGWHVPSDDDWNTLEVYLEINIGGRLKAEGTIEQGDGLWYSPNEGATDERGFRILPAGSTISTDNDYSYYLGGIGKAAYFWTNTAYAGYYGQMRAFSYESQSIYRNHANKYYALSVRCIQD